MEAVYRPKLSQVPAHRCLLTLTLQSALLRVSIKDRVRHSRQSLRPRPFKPFLLPKPWDVADNLFIRIRRTSRCSRSIAMTASTCSTFHPAIFLESEMQFSSIGTEASSLRPRLAPPFRSSCTVVHGAATSTSAVVSFAPFSPTSTAPAGSSLHRPFSPLPFGTRITTSSASSPSRLHQQHGW